MALTQDGRSALSVSLDGTLKLWNVETGQELDSTDVDGAPVCVATRGDLVAVGNADTTITLYRLNE